MTFGVLLLLHPEQPDRAGAALRPGARVDWQVALPAEPNRSLHSPLVMSKQQRFDKCQMFV